MTIKLEEVLAHSKIGNKSQILYVLRLLSKGPMALPALRTACSSRDFTFSASFDGAICLLKWLSVIEIDKDVHLKHDKQDIHKDNFITTFLGSIFEQMASERRLNEFLNCENILFQENAIFIRNNMILMKFAPLRDLVIDFGLFIQNSSTPNQVLVSIPLQPWFVETVLPCIDTSILEDNSLDNLLSAQEMQRLNGEIAENFVLAYEKIINQTHPLRRNIKKISHIDVKAGFDILSYLSSSSLLLDKMIEVKSYSGTNNLHFFWTRNEIKIAEENNDRYFLYLVNRDEIENSNYIPTIIQDPYKNVLNSTEWEKDCQSWQFICSQRT